MIPLWKGKNPIYFGVITIIPFDNLYRQAYFVMHTFLVLSFLKLNEGKIRIIVYIVKHWNLQSTKIGWSFMVQQDVTLILIG
jgi:hypothetical protein